MRLTARTLAGLMLAALVATAGCGKGDPPDVTTRKVKVKLVTPEKAVKTLFDSLHYADREAFKECLHEADGKFVDTTFDMASAIVRMREKVAACYGTEGLAKFDATWDDKHFGVLERLTFEALDTLVIEVEKGEKDKKDKATVTIPDSESPPILLIKVDEKKDKDKDKKAGAPAAPGAAAAADAPATDTEEKAKEQVDEDEATHKWLLDMAQQMPDPKKLKMSKKLARPILREIKAVSNMVGMKDETPEKLGAALKDGIAKAIDSIEKDAIRNIEIEKKAAEAKEKAEATESAEMAE